MNLRDIQASAERRAREGRCLMPATLIRNTTGWPFRVDDAVAAMGHKGCGGWQLSHAEDVICACGGLLLPLAEVISR